MPETALAAPTATAPSGPRGPVAVALAPYAVVRLAAGLPWAPSPEAETFRRLSARLVAGLTERDALREPVETALYGAAAGHDAAFQRGVVLPLRRDVHNGRRPRAAVRDALGDLTDRIPALARWLELVDELAAVAGELAEGTDAALAADRRALAATCAAEPLLRGVALTGADLLRAVERAAVQGDRPDSRARKSESTVLRYVGRVVTKTTPLSWFSFAGWGRWADGPGTDLHGDLETLSTVAVAQPDRGAVEAVVRALLTDPDLSWGRPHELEPGLRRADGQVFFRRPAPTADGEQAIRRESEIAVAATPLLDFVIRRVARTRTVTPDRLAEEIAGRLPAGTAGARETARHYVAQLISQGLLGAVYPVDPQALDAIGAIQAWAATALPAEGAATAREALAGLRGIAELTRSFPEIPGGERPRALAELRSRWDAVFATVRREPTTRRMPLTEDVTLRESIVLGPEHGGAARADLARLAPLFETFDLFPVVRRAARDRFVARYGVGATGVSVADFADTYAAIWYDPDVVGPAIGPTASGAAPAGTDATAIPDQVGAVADGTTTDGALERLMALRARLAVAAQAGQPVNDWAGGAPAVVELPEEVVTTAARDLPDWIRARPSSYAVFGQPVPAGAGPLAEAPTGMVVNRVYSGWGRFTSRFLPYFPPAAAEEVATEIRTVLADDGRAAQMRPTGGFNANLHPLLVDDEVAEAGATVHPDDVELVHDVPSDQLRLRHRDTGELISLLYLGFLVPVALPARTVPLLNDLGAGLVDVLATLRPTRRVPTPVGTVLVKPRLTYRSVVLGRRRWVIDADQTTAWRSELERDVAGPAGPVARWRAGLGLPEHVFVSGAPVGAGADLGALLDYLSAPKPQYVDLGSAVHQRNFSRALARYPHGVVIEEALPEPVAGRRATEVVVETYRRAG